jgi:hypothetical protein
MNNEHSICELYGWGAKSPATIEITHPEACNPNYPEFFCTIFTSTSQETCKAQLGSSVICDHSSLSGILMNNGSCSDFGSLSLLNYQSLEEFDEWIQQKVNGGCLNEVSRLMVAVGLLVASKGLL